MGKEQRVQQGNGRREYQVHIQSFLIYYLLFGSDWDIRAVVMMGCELQNAFWGTKFSFSVIRFLFIFYLMEATWHWWLGGCDSACVKMHFFTELWKGSTCSLNLVNYDFGNLVHLADLMKLHLGIANSLVCECSRKECDKNCPVFPFKWERCQVAWFMFECTLFMCFHSFHTYLHYILAFVFYLSSIT